MMDRTELLIATFLSLAFLYLMTVALIWTASH